MNNMKYATGLLAYVLIAAVFFAVGYASGTANGKNKMRETLAAQYEERQEAVNTSASANEEEPEYTVTLEGDMLTVYESSDSRKTKLTDCKISESVFPPEDIAALREGLVFEDRNEAMAMFENFAS